MTRSNEKGLPQFEVIETADGSPTISLPGTEKMHSLDGAFSESLYIYAPCIENALQTASPSILSMGLGLGYNELMAAAISKNLGVPKFAIHSFEVVDWLRESFTSWLNGSGSHLSEIYQTILNRLAEEYSLPGDEIKSTLQQSLSLHGAITADNQTGVTFQGILYDAFSGQTDPELWDQSFLEALLKNYSDSETCFLTTYAATGDLTRALRSSGFQVEKKPGFGKKRQSTFALRSKRESGTS